MTQKKRVHDLAKEYGLSGKDLVAKLQTLGFSQIKTHMTALSDFEELEIRGKLEAYGIVGETNPSQSKADLGGGLVVKTKKKALKPDEHEQAPVESRPVEPHPVPTPHDEPSTAHLPSAPVEVPAPAAHEQEPLVARPVPSPAVAEPALEPAAASQAPGPFDSPVLAPAASPAPREREAAPPLETEPVLAEAAGEAPVETHALEALAGPGTEPEVTIVRPGAKRRPGNVVGFIDLTKIQPQGAPRRPEARRLKSSDEDPAPDVMPTLGTDKKRGLLRGDVARAQLTQQQLRERESSRFLRKKSAAPSGSGGYAAQRRVPAPSKESGGLSPSSGKGLSVEAPLTVKNLAEAMGIKTTDLLRAAFKLVGFGTVNINSLLDDDTAVLLAAEFQVNLKVVHEVAAEEAMVRGLEQRRSEVGKEDLIVRPPCVAILGHVDHGKTTLIDAIRKSSIAAGESGGITQHIGAYQVTSNLGHTLTIIDTPGHAAFTAMRARGAKAVDIVVLVVAADDGVMPQSIEALEHARAAKAPIVVAINKIDKPGAKPDQVMNQLAQQGLIPEAWGGETAMLPVSGLVGTGVQELLERVFLESEVLELQSHPSGPAKGVVLEAEVQQGKGRVAHLLVQDGCLRRGDIILAGDGYGKVKSIHNDRGEDLAEAGPSLPVEVTGLNELPGVGDRFHVVESLDQAREVAEERARKTRQLSLAERRSISNENILQAVAEQGKKAIHVILKADVQGSVEVLRAQLAALQHAEVDLKPLLAGVGQVSESDVSLAISSKATILAFHVGTNGKARLEAERNGVEIRYYEVIYELLDEVRLMMEGSLAPAVSEQVTGHAEVRAVFKSSKFGNIAGCMILDGTIGRDHKARLLRNGRVLHTSQIGSLRREKDDVKEVREGFECGLTVRDYPDVQIGDVVETYKLVETKRLLKL